MDKATDDEWGSGPASFFWSVATHGCFPWSVAIGGGVITLAGAILTLAPDAAQDTFRDRLAALPWPIFVLGCAGALAVAFAIGCYQLSASREATLRRRLAKAEAVERLSAIYDVGLKILRMTALDRSLTPDMCVYLATAWGEWAYPAIAANIGKARALAWATIELVPNADDAGNERSGKRWECLQALKERLRRLREILNEY